MGLWVRLGLLSVAKGARTALPEVACEDIASVLSDMPHMDGWTSRFCTFWQQHQQPGDESEACPSLGTTQGWNCEDRVRVNLYSKRWRMHSYTMMLTQK
jgi:hypothetical protein